MSSIENGSQAQNESLNFVSPFPAEVVNHTSENGQVIWFNSAPKEVVKATSDQESESPKA